MLIKKGRISIEIGYQQFIKLVLESSNYVLRGITPEIAELSAQLLSHISGDPADSIIAATSITENAKLVTADKKLRQSGKIVTIW